MYATINKLLSLQKIVRERVTELRSLLNEVASEKTRFFDSETSTEIKKPRFEVKQVDKKIVELERFLFDLDFAIKESNATTGINIDGDIDKLLSPLEE